MVKRGTNGEWSDNLEMLEMLDIPLKYGVSEAFENILKLSYNNRTYYTPNPRKMAYFQRKFIFLIACLP